MIRFGLRNAHEYGHETYEAKRLRLRDRAEDPRPGIDLHAEDDRADEHTPVPWWAVDPSFKNLRSPMPALAGSCRTDAAPAPEPSPQGAAITSAAGGPGGNRLSAARPHFNASEAA